MHGTVNPLPNKHPTDWSSSFRCQPVHTRSKQFLSFWRRNATSHAELWFRPTWQIGKGELPEMYYSSTATTSCCDHVYLFPCRLDASLTWSLSSQSLVCPLGEALQYFWLFMVLEFDGSRGFERPTAYTLSKIVCGPSPSLIPSLVYRVHSKPYKRRKLHWLTKTSAFLQGADPCFVLSCLRRIPCISQAP